MLHPDELSMLRESMPEYLQLADIGLKTAKTGGGVLGYPSAMLLMSVVDAIGSYVREHPMYRIPVDGAHVAVKRTSDHILILNSEFFQYTFTDAELRDIYRLCRSPLTHNAIVGRGHVLMLGQATERGISFVGSNVVTNLPGLLEECRLAVNLFLAVADGVVMSSKAIAQLADKAAQAAALRGSGVQGPVASATGTSATGMGAIRRDSGAKL